MELGIVIPHAERNDLLAECIKSIPLDIFYIVENHGTFAENNNRGFKKLKEMGVKKVLFLNDDTVLNGECFGEMIKLSKTFDIVGARCVYPDGLPENFGGEINFRYGTWSADQTHEDNNRWVFPSGACFIISSEVYERCGMFNESYKNSYEDVELFLTAIEKGYKITQTESVIFHASGKSKDRFVNTERNCELLHERFPLKRIQEIVKMVRMERLGLRKMSMEEKIAFSKMVGKDVVTGLKTLLFSLMYVADEQSAGRYQKYLGYFRTQYHGLGISNLVFIDDGSERRNIELLQIPIFLMDSLPVRLPDISVVTFPTHLGRPVHLDFQGWWRSFLTAPIIAERYGFDKLIHIESDAYVLSERLIKYLAGLSIGWTTLWCQRHGFPEPAIQVIGKDQFETMKKVVPRADIDPEHVFPFTFIERESFKGDRYGEYQDFIPEDADYACQAENLDISKWEKK